MSLPAAHGLRGLLGDREFATEFFIISDLKLGENEEVSAEACRTEHPMCPRCRRYEPPATGESGDGAELCIRCAEVLSGVES